MYKGLIKKSRTYDFAALLVIFGAIQAALPTLLGPFNLPPEVTGLATSVIGYIVYKLRAMTNGPVGAK